VHAIADRSPPCPALAASETCGGPRRLGLGVLVVDDDPANLAFADDSLRSLGIAPTLAKNGAEAVALAAARTFDLILMDLQMPVLDGLAATKRIRADEHERSAARAPVLAYTGCAFDERLLRDCGLDGLLDKPCSARAFQDCVLRWCARALARDGAVA
jgi:CheY-like chemotaxis protein